MMSDKNIVTAYNVSHAVNYDAKGYHPAQWQPLTLSEEGRGKKYPSPIPANPPLANTFLTLSEAKNGAFPSIRPSITAEENGGGRNLQRRPVDGISRDAEEQKCRGVRRDCSGRFTGLGGFAGVSPAACPQH